MLFTVNGGQLYIETTVTEGMPLLMAFLEKTSMEGGKTQAVLPVKVKRGGGRPKGSKNKKSTLVAVTPESTPYSVTEDVTA